MGVMSDLRDAAERAVAAAAAVLDEANREILDVPAPLHLTTSGRLVAATAAEPGEAPRKVTGRLQVHANRYQVEPGVWFVGVFGVLYARILELEMNHKFISVTLSQQRPAIEAAVQQAAREGLG